MTDALALPRDLVAATVHFARTLREAGVLASPAEAIDATRALELLDLGDRREVYLALRSVLASRPEDFPIYDRLFLAFWDEIGRLPDPTDAPGTRPPPDGRAPPQQAGRRAAIGLEQWMQPGSAGREESEPIGVPRVSDRESLGQKDFSTFGAEELDEISRVARRIARRLASRPSRRWKPARRGERISLRRTARQSFRTAGEPVELAYQRRKQRKTRLVVLCDVSGSMDLYSRFLLQFLFALQNLFARVETFVFSTRLSRITEELRSEGYRGALDRVARRVHDWSGGTRIGASLAAFHAEWGDLLDRRTIVIILSDGWDTGEPEQLGEELEWIRRRAGKVIWLNPLLGSPSYEPLTRGMQAALPHVDVFAPAHNLASLQALVRHLVL